MGNVSRMPRKALRSHDQAAPLPSPLPAAPEAPAATQEALRAAEETNRRLVAILANTQTALSAVAGELAAVLRGLR